MRAVTDSMVQDPGTDEGIDSTPRVRTLLLTDLCDSTMLVERLGDNAAAELFREHDRLVLGLQQRWHGRLIDRSDGLLLLFERAIDGLGFALDYARGLREVGERRKVARHGIELRARSGLHVGEVLTWRNSDAAVSFGAKPLEVEGLAKPMAGRLMTLARPGQILLSATAEPLAHRAARELGERGEQLLWKAWGRWRFKGVPQPQEVYEVGEPGIAPLRAPRQNRSKAWRDTPIWRRPAALAAELLLVAGLAMGGWFLTRPQPAIAFGERDWVVVADLRNLTGDTLLDESLEQAFRISLEQSRYVNVLSNLKSRETLQRMRRSPDSTLDRAIASEIALRDGARAVILPTVAEIGGRVRVSAEVIDPRTQTTVYAESADGSGAASTLRSIDTVTSALRARLGEALQSIEKNSISLPDVSTANLDALKAYALGRMHGAQGDAKGALAYYLRAQRLDPQFALAMVDAGNTYIHSLGDVPAARAQFEKAAQLRSRLSPRESLQLEATLARFGPPGPAIERWRQLLELYPDQPQAHSTLAQMQLWDRNDFAQALANAQAGAVPQAERSATAKYLLGIVEVALGRRDDAIRDFAASRQLGYQGGGYSYAYAYAMDRDWKGVDAILAQLPPIEVESGKIEMHEQRALFAVDRGKWDDALAHAAGGVAVAEQVEPEVAAPMQRIHLLSVEVLAGRTAHEALARRINAEIDSLVDNPATYDAQGLGLRISMLHALGYLGARLDDDSIVARVLAQTTGSAELETYPLIGQMQVVLEAERDRLAGAPARAVERLQPLVRGADAVVPAHVAMLRARLASGDDRGAAAEATWLASHRGQAYVERTAANLVAAGSVADTTVALLVQAEIALRAGDREQARGRLAEFRQAWATAALPEWLGRRVEAVSNGLSRA